MTTAEEQWAGAPTGRGSDPGTGRAARRRAAATRAQAGGAAGRGRSRHRRLSGWVLLAARLVFIGALVGLWQLTVVLHLFPRTVTSSPSAVAVYLRHALVGSTLWVNLGATLEAAAIAWVLASVVGVVVGIGLGLLPAVERVVAPVLDAANSLPRIALAPVFVIAFGLTITAKLALAFSVVVFMLITSARAGMQAIDVDIVRLARSLGANRRQLFFKVMLPVAVPSIFGGLRLGVIYSILGVLTSELIGAKNGIGQLLQEYASLFQIEAVYGLLIVLAIVASSINSIMSWLERRILRWQAPTT